MAKRGCRAWLRRRIPLPGIATQRRSAVRQGKARRGHGDALLCDGLAQLGEATAEWCGARQGEATAWSRSATPRQGKVCRCVVTQSKACDTKKEKEPATAPFLIRDTQLRRSTKQLNAQLALDKRAVKNILAQRRVSCNRQLNTRR